MAQAFRLQQLLFANEASFAADTSGFAGGKVPFNSATLTLNHDRIMDEGMRERLAVHNPSNIGLRTAQLDINVNWCGKFTSTTTGVDATWLHTLLSNGLGGASTQAGADAGVGATGPAIYSIGSDHGLTATDGAIIRVGVKGDGRADGQATALDGTGGNLHVALPGAPNSTDNCYGTLMQYHDESASQSLTTQRFLALHATTGAQYRLLGGQLAGVSLALPLDNSIPTLTLSYQFAYWNRTATTYPETGTTIGSHEAAPIAGGSFAFSDINATASSRTRTTVTPAEINLAVDLGLQPVIGPGGANTYQNITAWSRTNAKTSLEFKIPWENTYETWWNTDNDSITYKNLMFTANTVAGRAVGFYCPLVRPVGPVPSQVVEVNEQNYVSVSLLCDEGTDTDSELTRSAIRFWMG